MEAFRRFIEKAQTKYQPVKTFALFSGGHDSLCSTHVSMSTGLCDGVVHCNTGIGIEQTRQFVRDTCASFGWHLLEYRAVDCGQVYRDIVLRMGFPGPAQHWRMYAQLKERPLRALKRDHAPRQRIMLLTGIRRSESSRRMGYVQPVNKIGQWIWVNPILEWQEDDCHKYMLKYNLPRNPVKDKLCISGECLCGAFAKKGERAELKALFPDTWAEIASIEAEAESAGVWHTWGSAPTAAFHSEQAGQLFMPLCSSCLAMEDEE